MTLICKNNRTFAQTPIYTNMHATQLSLFDDFDTTPTLPCPFLGRKVVVTGSFPQGRQSLRSTLLRLGATEVRYDKLQRNSHFLLTGENPNPDVINYWRLYVHDGYNIRRITSDDLLRIQNGDYTPYQMPEEITKSLKITNNHLYWMAPEIDGLKNTRLPSPLTLKSDDSLYNREIFVHTSIMEQAPKLAQILGCLGAYANTEMAEDTDSILIPKNLPDNICHAVEEYYNSSRATQFNIPFIILEELIEYIKKRAEKFPDEVFASLL